MTNALPRDRTSKSSVEDVCAMLGVPQRDWQRFSRWGAATSRHTPDALHAYLDVMIAERCTHRTDDLLSALIGLEIDGFAFTTDEIHLAVTTLVTMASEYERSSPAR